MEAYLSMYGLFEIYDDRYVFPLDTAEILPWKEWSKRTRASIKDYDLQQEIRKILKENPRQTISSIAAKINDYSLETAKKYVREAIKEAGYQKQEGAWCRLSENGYRALDEKAQDKLKKYHDAELWQSMGLIIREHDDYMRGDKSAEDMNKISKERSKAAWIKALKDFEEDEGYRPIYVYEWTQKI